jgi:hypothetical protein
VVQRRFDKAMIARTPLGVSEHRVAFPSYRRFRFVPTDERAFLFGLGCCLALMTVVVVKQEGGRLLSLGLPTAAAELTGAALVIFGVPAAFAFWRARRAPPNKSRWTAFGGWMLGFWIIPVMSLAAVWVIWSPTALRWRMGAPLQDHRPVIVTIS